jgi:hypothetical protein
VDSTISVTSREWVAAFYVILGILIILIVGIRPLALLLALLVVVLTLLASRACSIGKFSYWRGLRVVASINPTGETYFGQFFVLPALGVASVFSWSLGLVWLLGAREWPQRRWFAFLKAYQSVFLRRPRRSGK